VLQRAARNEDHMTISSVDFGELDAESEKNLADYFVDTGVLKKLALGQRQFVIGRKGSGKTALFRLATAPSLNQTQIIEVEFDQYPWEFHRQLKQSGMMAESAYESSWRFLLLLMMAKEWSETGVEPLRSSASRIVNKVLPDPRRGFWSTLISRVRNSSKICLPGGSIAGQVNLSLGSVDLGKEDASYAVGWMSAHLGELTLIAQGAYASHPVVIKVDRLDDGWDASSDSQALIVGELKAARAVNQLLHRSGMPAPVITFLRSDIYETVKFNDKNKMATSIERLDWTDQRLMEILTRRIVRSLGVAVGDAWGAAFSESEMRQRAKPKSYFIRRTMGRPRDVIAFAIHCKEVAVASNHQVVETADIYEAEKGYSQHLLNELTDELHKQLPELDTLLNTLREVGRMNFTVEDWTQAAQRRGATVTDATAKEQLRALFDAAVIGVARIGGSKGGSRHVFVYSQAYAKPDFGGRMRVHPGLKRALELKDGKVAEGGDEDADPEDELPLFAHAAEVASREAESENSGSGD
jgi:hypothetical protein